MIGRAFAANRYEPCADARRTKSIFSLRSFASLSIFGFTSAHCPLATPTVPVSDKTRRLIPEKRERRWALQSPARSPPARHRRCVEPEIFGRQQPAERVEISPASVELGLGRDDRVRLVERTVDQYRERASLNAMPALGQEIAGFRRVGFEPGECGLRDLQLSRDSVLDRAVSSRFGTISSAAIRSSKVSTIV
jgi:hypothetical protein